MNYNSHVVIRCLVKTSTDRDPCMLRKAAWKAVVKLGGGTNEYALR